MLVECENCVNRLKSLEEKKLIGEQARELLSKPRKVVEVTYPIKLDDGGHKFIEAVRVQYNSALGPTKGGVRFHPSVDVSEVSELAFLMTLKTALFNLPYGGAKGGVVIDPKEHSAAEVERVARGFVRSLRKFMGPDADIPAPDVNTNAEIMGWMLDEFEVITGAKSPAVFTGKPLVLGGSRGRETSTSLGGYFVIKKLEKILNLGKKVSIQGFGNVGSNIAKFLKEDGYTIVSVSDSSAGLYDEKGLPVDELIEWKRVGKSFSEWEKSEKVEDVLSVDADVLIPSALGGVITRENVGNIQAKYIVEMANAPIESDAGLLLEDRGVVVVPDILSNAGGVIVSYFEWVQNLQGISWDEEKVSKELQSRMDAAFDVVWKSSQEKKCSLRDAAYVYAIERIIKAEKSRGNI